MEGNNQQNCGGETDSDTDEHIGDVPAEGRATSGETQVQRVVLLSTFSILRVIST